MIGRELNTTQLTWEHTHTNTHTRSKLVSSYRGVCWCWIEIHRRAAEQLSALLISSHLDRVVPLTPARGNVESLFSRNRQSESRSDKEAELLPAGPSRILWYTLRKWSDWLSTCHRDVLLLWGWSRDTDDWRFYLLAVLKGSQRERCDRYFDEAASLSSLSYGLTLMRGGSDWSTRCWYLLTCENQCSLLGSQLQHNKSWKISIKTCWWTCIFVKTTKTKCALTSNIIYKRVSWCAAALAHFTFN